MSRATMIDSHLEEGNEDDVENEAQETQQSLDNAEQPQEPQPRENHSGGRL